VRTVFLVWFAALMAWQLLAATPWMQARRPGRSERRCEVGFYLFLYEFYMFAIRTPDIGIRYRVQGGASAWLALPLPWDRRWRDAIWNPEHELKKTIRTIASRLHATQDTHERLYGRVSTWLRAFCAYPEGTTFEYRIVDRDSFEAEPSTSVV
jgi:hypothetical protein